MIFSMERSTEQVTAGRVVISQIEEFLPQEGFSFESLLDTQMVGFMTVKSLNIL